MRARRHVRRPPDLTSLFDVLFIIVFVALIRAAAAQQALAAAEALQTPAKPAPQPPQPPAEISALRVRALATISADLAGRTPLVIRVSATGTLEMLEADGKKLPLDVPLLVHDPDSNIELAYQGDRSVELRVCRIAALHLSKPDLAGYLVIVAPARAFADLPEGLYLGLHRDLDRCLTDQHGLAAIVEPPPPAPKPTP